MKFVLYTVGYGVEEIREFDAFGEAYITMTQEYNEAVANHDYIYRRDKQSTPSARTAWASIEGPDYYYGWTLKQAPESPIEEIDQLLTAAYDGMAHYTIALEDSDDVYDWLNRIREVCNKALGKEKEE